MVSVCFNKFFRLPVCLGKDSLIVNTGRNSISSIQFHSHKLLQSWVLKQPHSFSCPVVYHNPENQLLSVTDKNTLLVWSYDADNLEEAKKIKFRDDIFGIVSVLNEQIVVFKSGTCLLLDDAISKHEFLTKSYLKSEEMLLWVDASPYESSLLIFLLTHTCEDVHKLHTLSLGTGDGKIEKSCEQVISRDSASLQSWCITSEDMHASFLTIWSDGQVHSYSGDCKSSVHLLTIPGVEEKESLAVEALDTCHIVVVRSGPSSGCSYELWDTRYSTKKSSKSVDVTLSQNLQAKVLGDTLFLPSNERIVAEPLKVAFSTLAAVVGKSVNKVEVQEDVLYSWEPDGMLHEESVEEEKCNDVSGSTFSIVTKNELFEELLTRLHQADAKTISSYLREIKLISESKLVKLLQYLLRKNHSEFKAHAKSISSENCAEQVAVISLELFCIPFNDIFLQQHLRKLSFKEALAAFEILSFLLCTDKFCSICQGGGKLSLNIQIVNWTCMLLFSHLEELTLSAEREMSAMIIVINALRQKIKKLDPTRYLLQLQHKKFDFENSTSTNYCIQSLHL